MVSTYQGRRRSSAGLILAALGAATLATAPIASAAPTTEPSSGGIFGDFGFQRRNSQPDIYERQDGGYRSKYAPEEKRSSLSKRSQERLLRARAAPCLDGTYDQSDINNLFSTGGDNTIVQLCQGITMRITGPVIFTNYAQELSTIGYPTGSARGKLVVTGQ